MNRDVAWIARPLLLLLVLAAVSCSPDSAAPKGSTSTSPSSSTNTAGAVAGAGSSAVAALPADVRVSLEKNFAHHVVLMMRVMRGKIDKEPEHVEAAERALWSNTKEITDVIRSVYGASESATFTKLWNQRIDALTAYSAARAKNDDEALAKAMTELRAYPARYGNAVNELTRGKIAEAPAKQRMSEHITLLTGAADAYASTNFPTAFARERTAYFAMFDNGTAFAKAAVWKRLGYLPPSFDDRAARLRAGIGRLLGAHSALAFETTRAVVSSKPSAEAAAAALNANTQSLLAALGNAPAEEFGGGWASSVEGTVEFAVAVAEFDTEGQTHARVALDAAPRELGARLAALSGGKVAAQTVAKDLRLQNEQTLKAVTSYAASDFDTSHDLAYAQFNHMFALADTMAGVLEGYSSVRAPRGGAKTGGGGSAAR